MIKENQTLLNRFHVLCDLALLYISMAAAYGLRFFVFPSHRGMQELKTYLLLAVAATPIAFLSYSFFDLYKSYRTQRFRVELGRVVKANLLLCGTLLIVLFLAWQVNISRWTIIIFFFLNTFLMAVRRYFLRMVLARIRAGGHNLKSLIIVGSGDTAREYWSVLQKNHSFGYHYLGYVGEPGRFAGTCLGGYPRLESILLKQRPEEVVCALDVCDAGQLEGIVSACEKTGTKISIIPFCYRYIPSRPYFDQVGHIPLINIRYIPLDNLANAFVKRAMDLVGSAVLLLLTSPIMAGAAIAVRLSSPGPVIFRQVRLGRNKEPFTMYKFRSMRLNSSSDTAWSTKSDPRRTKVGSFIRKYSIDELPQLWNVLLGNMSLVGPRPEIPFLVEGFKESVPLYMVKHQVKPGITGLAQVEGFRGDTSLEERIRRDIYYIENWSVMLDIQILLRTVFQGAFKNDEALPAKGKEPAGDAGAGQPSPGGSDEKVATK